MVNPSIGPLAPLSPQPGLPITRAMMRPVRHRLHAHESGFALIETLVGAVLLVVIALATLSGVDRAQKTSQIGKARSVAATLAEQDQERLRSMPATALSNYHPPARQVPVGGVAYDVVSRADWVRDSSGGTQSCTSDSTQSDYLKITSTVTSKVVGSDIRPVALSSLVAPPVGAFGANQGTLAVKVTGGADQPITGLLVSITGATSLSDVTNESGCAIFGYIPAGPYHVLLNQSGWVTPSGVTPVDVTQTVTAGSVTVQSLQYDRAGKVSVSFDTLVGGSPSRSRGWSATGSNTGVPGNGMRTSTGTAPPQPLVDVVNLFPFTTGYGMYSAGCAGANPVTAIPNASWFSGPGAGAFVVVPAGGNPAVTVRQPPLTMLVKNLLLPVGNANIVLTPQDTLCSIKPILTTDSAGRATKPSFDFGAPTGVVAYDPGVPFGRYDYCVDAVILGVRRRATGTVNVNAAAGVNAGTVNLALALPGPVCS
jgi:Tfp pilus assembly protein PilV